MQINFSFRHHFDESLLLRIYFRRFLSLFPSPFLRTVSKVKEKDVLVRSTANLKLFLSGRFTFFIYLKNSCFFFSQNKHTNFAFDSGILFFIASAVVSGFSFQSAPHSKDPILILRNSRFHYRLYIVRTVPSLKSNIDSIDTTVSLIRLFFLL